MYDQTNSYCTCALHVYVHWHVIHVIITMYIWMYSQYLQSVGTNKIKSRQSSQTIIVQISGKRVGESRRETERGREGEEEAWMTTILCEVLCPHSIQRVPCYGGDSYSRYLINDQHLQSMPHIPEHSNHIPQHIPCILTSFLR